MPLTRRGHYVLFVKLARDGHQRRCASAAKPQVAVPDHQSADVSLPVFAVGFICTNPVEV